MCRYVSEHVHVLDLRFFIFAQGLMLCVCVCAGISIDIVRGRVSIYPYCELVGVRSGSDEGRFQTGRAVKGSFLGFSEIE